MHYWKECCFCDENLINYSCDMVRLSVEFSENGFKEIQKLYNDASRLDVTIYPPCFKDFKYKYLIVVEIGESSATIGIGFNGTSKEDNFKGFIEFNPNKILPFWETELEKVLDCCISSKISRLDIAIDIPIRRSLIALEKDNRHYEYQYNSLEDKTEYLGRKNAPGRVKLYNKKVESKLSVEMTRLEITTEFSLEKFKSHLPIVHILAEYEQFCFADYEKIGLNNTDFVLIELLNNLDYNKKLEYLKKLGYTKQKKIKPYVIGENNKRLEIKLENIRNILAKLEIFVK